MEVKMLSEYAIFSPLRALTKKLPVGLIFVKGRGDGASVIDACPLEGYLGNARKFRFGRYPLEFRPASADATSFLARTERTNRDVISVEVTERKPPSFECSN